MEILVIGVVLVGVVLALDAEVDRAHAASRAVQDAATDPLPAVGATVGAGLAVLVIGAAAIGLLLLAAGWGG